MPEQSIIKEINLYKKEIEFLIKEITETSYNKGFTIKNIEKGFFAFIAKHIIFFKLFLKTNQENYFLKIIVSDLYFYILAIITNEARYVYLNERSIIENYMRLILVVNTKDNHVTYRLFENLKSKYSISESDYSLLRSEYCTACEYIHGGEILNENLIKVFSEYIKKKRELKDLPNYFERICKMIRIFDLILIKKDAANISGIFYKRKYVLEYLLGKNCVDELFKILDDRNIKK